MFKIIRLKNYRTHVDTLINMGPITLLIGNNNSGKTNLLDGIRHFSQLVARARPKNSDDEETLPNFPKEDKDVLRSADLFPHRHRLSNKKEPISFYCNWEGKDGEVEYTIELFEDQGGQDKVLCREKVRIKEKNSERWDELMNGWEKPDTRLLLRKKLDDSGVIKESLKNIGRNFFRDMAQAFSYHFQPSYLKGHVIPGHQKITPEHLYIPSQLGYEGGNLQEILLHANKIDDREFQRFIAALRRFEPTFHGIRRHTRKEQILWEFDIKEEKAGRLEEFPPDVVSDGLMKATAIALLTTLYYPPALILIEEIENGINPGNINQFMSWLWQAAGLPDKSERGYATQFILTSHSPSVLREFVDHLEYVYTVRLIKPQLKSDVRNLRDALDMLIGVGTVEGEIEEENGKRRIHIPKYQISELWYNGTIG